MIDWLKSSFPEICDRLSALKQRLPGGLHSSKEWIRNKYALLRVKLAGWKQKRKARKAKKQNEEEEKKAVEAKARQEKWEEQEEKPSRSRQGIYIAGAALIFLMLVVVEIHQFIATIALKVGLPASHATTVITWMATFLFFFLLSLVVVKFILIPFYRRAREAGNSSTLNKPQLERKDDGNASETSSNSTPTPKTSAPAPAATKRSRSKAAVAFWKLVEIVVWVAVIWALYVGGGKLHSYILGPPPSPIAYQPVANANYSDHKCFGVNDDVRQVHQKLVEIDLPEMPEGCFSGFLWEPEYWVDKQVLGDTIGNPATCWNALETYGPTSGTTIFPPFRPHDVIMLPRDTRAIRYQAKEKCGMRFYVNIPTTE